MGRTPRIRMPRRSVVQPPYPLNQFPQGFAEEVGKHVIAILATRPPDSKPRVEGKDWEYIFSKCIGAQWSPSNAGLGDVTSLANSCAWSAKSIKKSNPHRALSARLISGRNDPLFSELAKGIRPGEDDASALGGKILDIWNARFAALACDYRYRRTVVLLKSDDLTRLSVFEFETTGYDPAEFTWRWNSRNNLEGDLVNPQEGSTTHKFTWQPNGSQFTIIEKVPRARLKLSVQMPNTIPMARILKEVGFSPSWITMVP
jgi:hypothetical protein